MALTDENGGGMNATMLMQPAYGIPYGGGFGGGYGMGGDFMSWILLILLLGGGFGGFGFGGGYGAMMGMGMMDGFGLYPWLNNSQNINDGFRDQMMNTSINGIQNSINGLSTQLCQCCGDVQLGLANGFNGVNNSIFGAQTAISQQLNTNEIANLNRSFAEQTANMQGFNGVQSGIADLRYTEATEACATRNASAQNTRDIIDSQTRGTQAILDKLCALELDGVKGQLAQAQRENVALQNAVNMATMQASQTAQTAAILQGQNAEVDALYNRLKNCPVNAVPVYGSQPIFTCPNNNSCGCGNNF
jgi:hypothetical protein